MGYQSAPEGWWQDFVTADPPRTAKLAVTRKDGSPHVAPVWVDLERSTGPQGEDVVVFMTSADTVKGKSIVRDGRVALCWDDERPTFSFVTVTGRATTSTDPDDLLAVATRIGGRYMGADQAEAYGRRNAVEPEMVIRVVPDRVVAKVDVAGFD
ncbi:MAG: PPOX class F420-dependent oxidoreductase [Ilumatobacter sp.]|uniref:PPOX class F420-dependent oxidoreductase n=1 Tax=Ilumatobacter sp. TaxID=1967498 RepID=UPI002628917A|nr:PPOX class F420-dependent oxidoreductase [Ilumatobacter sp.]MDJ0767819.1 PPOX class F420-dependent oxidoreductase [Ilumatobacter sp.]